MLKLCLFVCLFVCLSKPIRNELFYFKTFQSFDQTLLQVIGGQECESEVGFSIPPVKQLVMIPEANTFESEISLDFNIVVDEDPLILL